MPHDTKQDGYCNANVKQGEGYCANRAGFRTDHVGDGRCYLHGGLTENAGAPEGNTNAETHGLYTDRQSYYEDRTDDEKEWIDAITESLLLDAPFDKDNFAKYEMVRNIAIDMHKLRRANDYIDHKGVVHRDKTVGYTDDGKPIKMDEENVLNVAYDRLNRTLTRQLKELGILDDPDSKRAEAEASIAKELAKQRRKRDSE